MGHPQPMTKIQTNNLAAHSVVMKIIKTKITKAMDIHFHWMRCRYSQGHFRYYWKRVKHSLADSCTKHHPASNHKSNREKVFTPKCQLEILLNTKERTEKQAVKDSRGYLGRYLILARARLITNISLKVRVC